MFCWWTLVNLVQSCETFGCNSAYAFLIKGPDHGWHPRFTVHNSGLSLHQCPTLCSSRCPYRGLSADIAAVGKAVRPGPRVTASSVASNKGIHHATQEPWQESPYHAIVPQIWTYHLITLPCHLIALSRCRLVKRRDLLSRRWTLDLSPWQLLISSSHQLPWWSSKWDSVSA